MKSAAKTKIGLVQMACGGDPAENLRRAIGFVRDAAKKGAKIVCLPELFRSRYFCQREDPAFFDLAEPVPGPSTRALASVARDLRVAIVASLFEKRARGLYHNTAAVIDADGSIAGTYRKMHIPDDPSFYEKYYFTPGDLGFHAIDTAHGRVGVMVCWDQWYPEAARLTALQGADILFYPTAIGWHPEEKSTHGASQRDAWQTIQRAHAIANGAYVVAVNRVGHEVITRGTPGLEFWGTSFVSDPFGVVIAEASTDREETIVVEADSGRIEEVRRNWPFLRDRRIDAYGGLTERFADGKKRTTSRKSKRRTTRIFSRTQL
jgi:N-carbamoylputrescine amidase